MATHKLLLLPGDGIGPEVMAEVKKLIAFMNAHGLGTFETEEALKQSKQAADYWAKTGAKPTTQAAE